MIETILSTLLISSLIATGSFFLKWIEAKKKITELKKENFRLQTCMVETSRKQIEETNLREKEKRIRGQGLTFNKDLTGSRENG